MAALLVTCYVLLVTFQTGGGGEKIPSVLHHQRRLAFPRPACRASFGLKCNCNCNCNCNRNFSRKGGETFSRRIQTKARTKTRQTAPNRTKPHNQTAQAASTWLKLFWFSGLRQPELARSLPQPISAQPSLSPPISAENRFPTRTAGCPHYPFART